MKMKKLLAVGVMVVAIAAGTVNVLAASRVRTQVATIPTVTRTAINTYNCNVNGVCTYSEDGVCIYNTTGVRPAQGRGGCGGQGACTVQ